MKNKSPKTIADLDINWTFHEDYATSDNFSKLNPTICKLRLKPDIYKFVFENYEFTCSSYDYEALSRYFIYFNNDFFFHVRKEIKLSHFERVSDTKYIIHGK